MPTTASKWRIQLAHQIAGYYPAEAVLLVGSAANGLADAWSDLDLLMYWQAVPDVATRRQIAERIGGKGITWEDTTDGDFALQSQGDTFRLGEHALKVDITHKTRASVEALMADVTQHHDLNPIKLGVLNGFMGGMAVTGHDLLSQWREQIGDLPAEMIQPLLDRYLDLTAYDLVLMIVRRGDALFARELITGWCTAIVMALQVINRKYPPLRAKHLAAMGETMAIQPEGLAKRIRQICNAPIAEAIELAKPLIEDTFSLISQQGYDVTAAIARFQQIRLANHRPIRLDQA
ncbi:MAG: nucleotidyltransferase domain-containing protein [Anaerolineaceae bacterium]|nr:nucleotidyltransferase domain-containing protein [Anaerolineaceae bacterium]